MFSDTVSILHQNCLSTKFYSVLKKQFYADASWLALIVGW